MICPRVGNRLNGVYALNVGGKFGVQYRLNDRITLGAAYTTPTELGLSGGELKANFSALGLGRVKYRKAKITGLGQPQEAGIGIAARITKPWLVSLEVNWLDWSAAVNESTLKATRPTDAAAPRVLRIKSADHWRDQIVFAVGTYYELTPKWILRAGYNYGKNPIPKNRANPLLAAITEHHATFGAGYKLNDRWRLDGGFEYMPKKKVTHSNPALPFGAGAQEQNHVMAVHFTLSWQWR